MWARVTTITGDPSRLDEAQRMVNDQIIPRTKETGAKKGYFMMDRQSGTAVAVVLFETEAALRDSAQAAAKIRETAQQVGGTVQSVQELEVIGEL